VRLLIAHGAATTVRAAAGAVTTAARTILNHLDTSTDNNDESAR